MSTTIFSLKSIRDLPIDKQIAHYERQLEEINKKRYLTPNDFKTYRYCKDNLKRLQNMG